MVSPQTAALAPGAAENSMLQIAVINESTAIADSDVHNMLPAFTRQWNHELNDVWGVGAAQFSFLRRGIMPASGSWWVVFLDDSHQADSLAYHDLTDEGLPIAKVFVKSILADKASVSVGATHEICEMAVDPWLNSAYQDPAGTFWAGEVCDPVQDDEYGYEIDGVLVTDFVTPDWFAHAHAGRDLDYTNHARKAFKVLSGGYAQKYDAKKGWIQMAGAKAKKSKKAKAAKGSRRARRAGPQKGKKSRRFKTRDEGGGTGPH